MSHMDERDGWDGGREAPGGGVPGHGTQAGFRLSALNAVARAIREGGVEPSRHAVVRSSIRVLCLFARQDQIPLDRLLIDLQQMMSASDALDGVPSDRREETRSDIARLATGSYARSGRPR
jgi:hypothetical protein